MRTELFNRRQKFSKSGELLGRENARRESAAVRRRCPPRIPRRGISTVPADACRESRAANPRQFAADARRESRPGMSAVQRRLASRR